MSLAGEKSRHTDGSRAKNQNALTDLYIALICCVEADGKGLDQRTFLRGDILRKLEAVICRELDELLVAACNRRSCKKLNVGAKVVLALLAELAGSVCNAGLQADTVANLQSRNAFANLYNGSCSLVAKHVVLAHIHLISSALAAVIVMNVRSADSDILQRNHNISLSCCRLRNLLDDHVVQSVHESTLHCCHCNILLTCNIRYIYDSSSCACACS